MKIGYADPPYPGLAHYYRDHPDYGGEVDHAELVNRLEREYDGWVLHTHVRGLATVLPLVAHLVFAEPAVARLCAWVKPFAAFKANVAPAYAWEPVIVKACRKPTVGGAGGTLRDWVAENITLERGLVGAKPEAVCWWAFDAVGAERDDELVDLYPGSGAVGRAWDRWQRTPDIFTPAPDRAAVPSLLPDPKAEAS